MYVEWQRQTRAGMKRLMLSSVPLYERTKLFRIYEHNIIPGLFQTAEYSAAMLSYFIDFLDAPNDLDAAVEARMERQRIIYSGNRRFVVVLEEEAIRARVGDFDTMSGQLDRMLGIMSLPRISLGVIPSAAPRKVFTSVGFWVYDDAMVRVETPTASLEVTQPREMRLYATMFGATPAVSGVRSRSQSVADPRDGRPGQRLGRRQLMQLLLSSWPVPAWPVRPAKPGDERLCLCL